MVESQDLVVNFSSDGVTEIGHEGAVKVAVYDRLEETQYPSERVVRGQSGRGRGYEMSIKSDTWIRKQAVENKMIEPFSEKQVRDGVISYGLSSYGYDLRVSNEFKIFTNVNSAIIDPKNFDERSFVSVEADSIIVPPNSFALARSVEYFRIPRDVLTICVGKSTYARCGIIVNVTPFEPEWRDLSPLRSPIQPHSPRVSMPMKVSARYFSSRVTRYAR